MAQLSKIFQKRDQDEQKKKTKNKTKNQKNQTMSDWYDNVYLTTHYCYNT